MVLTTGQKIGHLTSDFFLPLKRINRVEPTTKKEPIKKFKSIFSLNTNEPIITPIGMVV